MLLGVNQEWRSYLAALYYMPFVYARTLSAYTWEFLTSALQKILQIHKTTKQIIQMFLHEVYIFLSLQKILMQISDKFEIPDRVSWVLHVPVLPSACFIYSRAMLTNNFSNPCQLYAVNMFYTCIKKYGKMFK